MADNEPKLPPDNTPEWLKEVKADAQYEADRRERERLEKLAHEAAKAEKKDK